MNVQITQALKTPLVELLFAIADDKLMLGHRASDWTGLAPILEEDIAFSAISQEEIAHASALYEIAGEILERSPDQIAFGRRPEEYRCAHLVTLDDGFDWAQAIVRQFFCDHLDVLRLGRLSRSNCRPLADLAARIAAEERCHVEHADTWIEHLGGGDREARQRLQAALESLAPEAAMLFEPTERCAALGPAGIYPGSDDDMFRTWLADLRRPLAEVGLQLDVSPPARGAAAGRRGKHAAHFAALLDEMCEVYRIEPGAAW